MQREELPGFGYLLRRYRLRSGLTQEGLAESALLSARSIQDLERGISRRPHRDTIDRLIEALNLDEDDRRTLRATARLPALSIGASDIRSVQRRDQHSPSGGYLGAAPVSPLVARERELDCVLGTLKSAAAGAGSSVVLAGEAGVGKTRLAQEVAVRARELGFIVATGSCYESRRSVSYYPFLDALGSLYSTAPVSISSAIPQRWPYMERLLPDAEIPCVRAFSDAHEEQDRLFRAIAGFIVATSDAVPVALLLDDLHWADEATLQLLQHVILHTRGRHVFLLGTFRDVEVRRHDPLERTLTDLHRDRLIARVNVRRLGRDETVELIRASLPESTISPEVADLIYAHTDGNPFFTQEVVQTLVERGDLYRENGRWMRRAAADVEVPESVRSVILQRLLRLDEDTQEILSEASVLGHTFTFDDLHAMSRWAESRVEDGLRQALAAGLVREAGEADYVFNHSLTQQVLYLELPGRRRRRLHLAAAEALGSLPEVVRAKRAPELSRHFIQGGDPERALPYALLAGREAEQVFAFRMAERRYQSAFALAQDLNDRGRQAEALERLGTVLASLIRYDEAIDMLEQAASSYHVVGDADAEGRVVAALGQVHRCREAEYAGIARVEPMIESMEKKGSTATLALLYLARAGLAFAVSDSGRQIQYADRAVEIASSLDDHQLVTEAKGLRGNALLNLRRLDEAASTLTQVLSDYEKLNDPIGMCGALYDMAYVWEARGQFAEAGSCFERGLLAAQRTADPALICKMLGGLAWNALAVGQWRRMRNYMAEIESVSEPFHDPGMLSTVLWLRIALSLQQGNYEAASGFLAETTALAEKTGGAFIWKQSRFQTASLFVLKGQPEAAVPLLQEQQDEHYSGLALSVLPLLAEAYLLSEELERAESVSALAVRRASASGDRQTLMRTLRVRGMLLTRQDELSEASRVLGEALALAERMRMPWEEARIRYEIGMTYASGLERESAGEEIQKALAIFQRLGAEKNCERMEQALVEVGET